MSFSRIMQLLSFIGVILVFLFSDKTNPIRVPKYLVFYLFFILFVFYSDLIRLDRDFKIMYLFSNKLIGSFNMMLIIENMSISKKRYRFLVGVSKIVLIIAIVVIMIQQVVDSSFFLRTGLEEEGITINNDTSRLYSIYTWSSGNILAAGFGFVPIFILIVEDMDKRKRKIMVWILIGFIFAFLSKQRWLMINILLVLVVLFSNHKEKAKRFVKFIFLVPLFTISLFFLLNSIGIDASGIAKNRLFEGNKKSISETTAGTRILAFYAFDKFYWDHPYIGIGNIKYGMGGTGKQDYKLRSFLKGRSSQIHVGYLSLLYMYGLIGAFLFLSFLYLLLKKLYRNAKHTGVWAPFLGILGVAIDNLFDVNFQLLEMGLIIVLVADRYYTQAKKYKIQEC